MILILLPSESISLKMERLKCNWSWDFVFFLELMISRKLERKNLKNSRKDMRAMEMELKSDSSWIYDDHNHSFLFLLSLLEIAYQRFRRLSCQLVKRHNSHWTIIVVDQKLCFKEIFIFQFSEINNIFEIFFREISFFFDNVFYFNFWELGFCLFVIRFLGNFFFITFLDVSIVDLFFLTHLSCFSLLILINLFFFFSHFLYSFRLVLL